MATSFNTALHSLTSFDFKTAYASFPDASLKFRLSDCSQPLDARHRSIFSLSSSFVSPLRNDGRFLRGNPAGLKSVTPSIDAGPQERGDKVLPPGSGTTRAENDTKRTASQRPVSARSQTSDWSESDSLRSDWSEPSGVRHRGGAPPDKPFRESDRQSRYARKEPRPSYVQSRAELGYDNNVQNGARYEARSQVASSGRWSTESRARPSQQRGLSSSYSRPANQASPPSTGRKGQSPGGEEMDDGEYWGQEKDNGGRGNSQKSFLLNPTITGPSSRAPWEDPDEADYADSRPGRFDRRVLNPADGARRQSSTFPSSPSGTFSRQQARSRNGPPSFQPSSSSKRTPPGEPASLSLAAATRSPPWLSSSSGRRTSPMANEAAAPGGSVSSRPIALPTGRPPWVPGPSTLPDPARQPSGSIDLDADLEAESLPGGPPLPSWLASPSGDRGGSFSDAVERDTDSRFRRRPIAPERSFLPNLASAEDSFMPADADDKVRDWDSLPLPEIPPRGQRRVAKTGRQGPGLDQRSDLAGSGAQRDSPDPLDQEDSEVDFDSVRSSSRASASERNQAGKESAKGSEHVRPRRYKKPPSAPLPDPEGDVEVAPMDLPFEFKFSYTETPTSEPIGYREPVFSPFGPQTMSRPWTGRAPLQKSKKNKLPRILPEFDSFAPPEHRKGVKPVQAPGPYGEGKGPKYVRTREEVLGEPLTRAEVKELLEDCNRYGNRQINLGRDGLVHNMLDNIHSHWKRRRVCKLKCKGVPTVDMDNVCAELEDKSGGKIIERRGGVVFLYRGRHYNFRLRPHIPLMLWKPPAPIYPRLVQEAPEGLTRQEANEMRKMGRKIDPIIKLGKNGVYLDLVQRVRSAFEHRELAKVDCAGMHKSDYKKIGAKLRDLVPCVLMSFEKEQILMWRGPPPGTVADGSEADGGTEAIAGQPGSAETGQTARGKPEGGAAAPRLEAEPGSGLLVEASSERQLAAGLATDEEEEDEDFDINGDLVEDREEDEDDEDGDGDEDEDDDDDEGSGSWGEETKSVGKGPVINAEAAAEAEKMRMLREGKYQQFESLWEKAFQTGKAAVVDREGTQTGRADA